MFYYLVSILKSPITPLTYAFDEPISIGSIVEVSLSKRLVEGVVLEEVNKPSFTCESIIALKRTFYPPKTLELAHFIAEYYVCSLGEALSLFTPFKQQSSALSTVFPPLDITLSPEQQNAYDFAFSHDTSLLFGDTGSGKTEIYMKLFELLFYLAKFLLLHLQPFALK